MLNRVFVLLAILLVHTLGANAQTERNYSGEGVAYRGSDGKWYPARVSIDNASRVLVVDNRGREIYDSATRVIPKSMIRQDAEGIRKDSVGIRQDEESRGATKLAGALICGMSLGWMLYEANERDKSNEDTEGWYGPYIAGAICGAGVGVWQQKFPFPVLTLPGGFEVRLPANAVYSEALRLSGTVTEGIPRQSRATSPRFGLGLAPREDGVSGMASFRF